MGTGVDFTYTPANGDIISCRLTSNYRCRLATTVTSNSIALHVDSAYIPSVTIEANPGLTIAPETEATLTAVVTGAGTAPTYQWQLNGGTISGATNSVYKSTFVDNDVVTCVVYGTGPCGLPSFNMVTMKVVEGAGVGHTDIAKSDIRLMPNPNAGMFTVEGNFGMSNEPTLLEVTNMLGQVVYRDNVKTVNGKFAANVALERTVANGIYILSVTSGGNRRMLPFTVKD